MVYAVAAVLRAADVWEAFAATTRCPRCGARLHRSDAEQKLATAVHNWRNKLRLKKQERFEEEAPTKKKT